jgi:hypothetical protein
LSGALVALLMVPVRFALADANCNVYNGFSVCGAILAKYLSLGGPDGILGVPVTNELDTPDKVGKYHHFKSRGSNRDDGSIYWTPRGGAWSIHGAIRDKWASLGWEKYLGWPVTDENGTPDGKGAYNHFSSTGNSPIADGSIYSTPLGGAWSIRGEIRKKWASMGWENSPLGYPVTDETATPDHTGAYNHFSSTGNSPISDGSVYFTPGTGAQPVYGAIRGHWAWMGWERGKCGYPTGMETHSTLNGHDYYSQPFQRGIVAMEATNGTSDSCSYNPDYRRESEVLFPVTLMAEPTDPTPCQGYAWIGQTQTLSVEAVTNVRCPYANPVMTLTASTRISDSPELGTELAEHREACMWALSCLSSVSTPGATGRRYCVNAYITVATPVRRDAVAYACIWT